MSATNKATPSSLFYLQGIFYAAPSEGEGISVIERQSFEPEGGLWSKGCAASQKQSWECLEFQQMINGSHSPGQQFSEVEDGGSRFPLSKAGQLVQQGWLLC